MSETYSPHTWNTGDIITDTSLNHLETGLYNLNQAVNSGAAAAISILTPSDATLTLAPFPTTYKWGTNIQAGIALFKEIEVTAIT